MSDASEEGRLGLFSGSSFGRRALIRGGGLGLAGLTAAALVGCDDDDDDDDDDGTATATATPTATSAATGTATPTATEAPSGPSAEDYPVRAPHSDAAVQSYAEDFHWSRVRPAIKAEAGQPGYGGVAVLSAASFGLATLHPTVEPVGQWPFCFTHSNLLGMGFDNPNYHNTTEDWSVSESFEVPDELTVLYHLRNNVTWHDKPPANGEPLSVDDVVATYDLYKNSPLHADQFAPIESFTEPEPNTLQMTLNEPASHMVNILRVPQFSLLNKRHIDEGDDALSTKAIGTGAFTQEQFQPDTKRVYKKNPNYWLTDDDGNQLPFADGVVHSIITDPAAALAAFRTQQVDAYKPTSIQEFDQLREELDVWAQVHAANCACLTQQLIFSRRNPLFDDVRVRRAFVKAIDLQSILDLVFGGAGSQTSYIAWPWMGRPWPEPLAEMGEWYQYDPAEAQKMLDASGVGEISLPIIFQGELGPGGGSIIGDPYLDSVRTNLREVGIELDPEGLDGRSLNRVFFGQEWDGLARFRAGTATALDADTYLRFIETGAGLNASSLSDSTLDDMILSYRREYDFDARNEIAQNIDAYVAKDQVSYGVALPQNFGLILWQRYMVNLVDAPAWWITGGAGQEFQEMYLTDAAPGGRDIDSF